MNKNSSLVLKTDGRGRVRTPRAQREALVVEFERSGLSAARFAALAGVKYQTFCTWRHQRRGDRGLVAQVAPVPPRALFMEAVAAPQGSGPLRLCMPGGCFVEFADASQTVLAAALVRELSLMREVSNAELHG